MGLDYAVLAGRRQAGYAGAMNGMLRTGCAAVLCAAALGLSACGAREAGEAPPPYADDYPSVQDGARGVHFVHTAVVCAREGRWMDAAYEPPGRGG